MTLRLIRAVNLTPARWKNGGGATTEIAAFPDGADIDSFAWRISMADIAVDGPFSAFPGVDRTLVLIRGECLDLEVAGLFHRLDARAPLLSFPGDVPTAGLLPNGPVRDFNVMTRRDRFWHRVRLAEAGIVMVAHTGLILAHDRPLTITGIGETHEVEPLDCVLCFGPVTLQVSGPALLVLIDPVEPI